MGVPSAPPIRTMAGAGCSVTCVGVAQPQIDATSNPTPAAHHAPDRLIRSSRPATLSKCSMRRGTASAMLPGLSTPRDKPHDPAETRANEKRPGAVGRLSGRSAGCGVGSRRSSANDDQGARDRHGRRAGGMPVRPGLNPPVASHNVSHRPDTGAIGSLIRSEFALRWGLCRSCCRYTIADSWV